MMRPVCMTILLAALLATSSSVAWAQDPQDEQPPQENEAVEEVAEAEPNGNGVDSPKTMSGMSILGNEEAPKSLVIIPWKSSRLGDEISLSDTLDDRAQPVDKDVFLRELRFHEIRSGEQT
ncbi:MAG: hypothetical protein ACR2QS_14000 [Woeseiaceae bacterium]